jgi:hypothetical protein
MTDLEDSPLTPAQETSYKKLRWVAFVSGVAVGALLIWQSINHGRMRSMLAGFHDPTSRASALAISVLVGLGVLWLAAGNIAKILARKVRS